MPCLQRCNPPLQQLQAVGEGRRQVAGVLLVFVRGVEETEGVERRVFVGFGEVGVVGVGREGERFGQFGQRLVVVQLLAEILHFVIHIIL
jgi:hypothetical protein